MKIKYKQLNKKNKTKQKKYNEQYFVNREALNPPFLF
jgi:hypothetical protein